MLKNKVGEAGEAIAAQYLEEQGFAVLERRCRIGHLETDIIAANDEYILFTEVKTRCAFPKGSHPFGTPAAAVDRKKRDRLIAAAEGYLRLHRQTTSELQPRMDVIEIYLDPREDTPVLLSLNHIKNAIRRSRTEVR